MREHIKTFEELIDESELSKYFATIAVIGSASHKRRGKMEDFDVLFFGDRTRYNPGQIIKANYDIIREFKLKLNENGLDIIPFNLMVTMEDRAYLSNFNPNKGDALFHNLLYLDVDAFVGDGFKKGDFPKTVEKDAEVLKGDLDVIHRPEFEKEVPLTKAYFILSDAVNCSLTRGPEDWLSWKLYNKNSYVRKHAFQEKVYGRKAVTIEDCFDTLKELDKITA